MLANKKAFQKRTDNLFQHASYEFHSLFNSLLQTVLIPQLVLGSSLVYQAVVLPYSLISRFQTSLEADKENVYFLVL